MRAPMLTGAGAMINLIARTVRRGANWFGRRRLACRFRPGKNSHRSRQQEAKGIVRFLMMVPRVF